MEEQDDGIIYETRVLAGVRNGRERMPSNAGVTLITQKRERTSGEKSEDEKPEYKGNSGVAAVKSAMCVICLAGDVGEANLWFAVEASDIFALECY